MSATNIEQKLESVCGPLLSVLATKIDLATWQNAMQLTAEMVRHPELRSVWFWTSDSNLTHVVGDDVEYILGDISTNLLARNIPEARRQLGTSHNYFPPIQEKQFVLRSTHILRVRASELGEHLQEYSYPEMSYVQVKPEILARGRQWTFAQSGEDLRERAK